MNQTTKSKRILLVEDENDYFEIVSSIVKKELGFEIERAEDGKKGFEKILKNNYDLLILDIGLPYINGIEILRKIREKRLSVPVLIFSVRSELSMIKDAISLGISGYIIKPFEPRELINKINDAFKK